MNGGVREPRPRARGFSTLDLDDLAALNLRMGRFRRRSTSTKRRDRAAGRSFPATWPARTRVGSRAARDEPARRAQRTATGGRDPPPQGRRRVYEDSPDGTGPRPGRIRDARYRALLARSRTPTSPATARRTHARDVAPAAMTAGAAERRVGSAVRADAQRPHAEVGDDHERPRGDEDPEARPSPDRECRSRGSAGPVEASSIRRPAGTGRGLARARGDVGRAGRPDSADRHPSAAPSRNARTHEATNAMRANGTAAARGGGPAVGAP
jgi:hypothetical protein